MNCFEVEVEGVLLRDQRVGVGRIADHQHLDVAPGVVVQRLALRSEDRAVGLEQVLALHAGAARARADQQGVVDVLEGDVEVVGGDDAGQGREGAVVELHHHALQRGQRRGDLEQVQDHRLIGAEHVAGGDAEQQGVTDLAGGAGDGNTDGSFHRVDLAVVQKIGVVRETGPPAAVRRKTVAAEPRHDFRAGHPRARRGGTSVCRSGLSNRSVNAPKPAAGRLRKGLADLLRHVADETPFADQQHRHAGTAQQAGGALALRAFLDVVLAVAHAPTVEVGAQLAAVAAPRRRQQHHRIVADHGAHGGLVDRRAPRARRRRRDGGDDQQHEREATHALRSVRRRTRRSASARPPAAPSGRYRRCAARSDRRRPNPARRPRP